MTLALSRLLVTCVALMGLGRATHYAAVAGAPEPLWDTAQRVVGKVLDAWPAPLPASAALPQALAGAPVGFAPLPPFSLPSSLTPFGLRIVARVAAFAVQSLL